MDLRLNPSVTFHLVLRPHISDRAYYLYDSFQLLFCRRVNGRFIRFGIGSDHYRLGFRPAQAFSEVLPQLLGQEGHIGVQETKRHFQNMHQNRNG